MKQQDMMDSLLSLGVQRGRLTCQELNDAFPAEFLPLEELERFLRLLEGLGVRVIDTVKGPQKKRGAAIHIKSLLLKKDKPFIEDSLRRNRRESQCRVYFFFILVC